MNTKYGNTHSSFPASLAECLEYHNPMLTSMDPTSKTLSCISLKIKRTENIDLQNITISLGLSSRFMPQFPEFYVIFGVDSPDLKDYRGEQGPSQESFVCGRGGLTKITLEGILESNKNPNAM